MRTCKPDKQKKFDTGKSDLAEFQISPTSEPVTLMQQKYET